MQRFASTGIRPPKADALPPFRCVRRVRMYKPNFRVGTSDEYLGVAFIDGAPSIAPPGTDVVATIALIYEGTGVDYAQLVSHAQFEVLEGARVIGEGTVVRRWHESRDWRERVPG